MSATEINWYVVINMYYVITAGPSSSVVSEDHVFFSLQHRLIDFLCVGASRCTAGSLATSNIYSATWRWNNKAAASVVRLLNRHLFSSFFNVASSPRIHHPFQVNMAKSGLRSPHTVCHIMSLAVCEIYIARDERYAPQGASHIKQSSPLPPSDTHMPMRTHMFTCRHTNMHTNLHTWGRTVTAKFKSPYVKKI